MRKTATLLAAATGLTLSAVQAEAAWTCSARGLVDYKFDEPLRDGAACGDHKSATRYRLFPDNGTFGFVELHQDTMAEHNIA